MSKSEMRVRQERLTRVLARIIVTGFIPILQTQRIASEPNSVGVTVANRGLHDVRKEYKR